MKWRWPALPVGWNKVWERYKYILLVVLVGVVLLLMPGGEPAQAKQAVAREQSMPFELQEMENKLAKALSRIQGAGEVSVVLTLKEGSRQVLARDIQVSDNVRQDTTVIVSQGSGVERAVPVQSIYPKYQGALVVCPGGADARVKLELLEAVRALTGLSAEKIVICKGQ